METRLTLRQTCFQARSDASTTRAEREAITKIEEGFVALNALNPMLGEKVMLDILGEMRQ